jgi:hypothetical protein
VYRIGFLSGAPREWPLHTAFFAELRGFGFVEGQNLFGLPEDLVFVTSS